MTDAHSLWGNVLKIIAKKLAHVEQSPSAETRPVC